MRRIGLSFIIMCIMCLASVPAMAAEVSVQGEIGRFVLYNSDDLLPESGVVYVVGVGINKLGPDRLSLEGVVSVGSNLSSDWYGSTGVIYRDADLIGKYAIKQSPHSVRVIAGLHCSSIESESGYVYSVGRWGPIVGMEVGGRLLENAYEEALANPLTLDYNLNFSVRPVEKETDYSVSPPAPHGWKFGGIKIGGSLDIPGEKFKFSVKGNCRLETRIITEFLMSGEYTF